MLKEFQYAGAVARRQHDTFVTRHDFLGSG
jgi:hypothetical protein